MKLGVEDIIKISAARQAYGCAKSRFETKYLSQDLGDIFGLEGTSGVQRADSTDEDDFIESLEGEVSDAQAAFAALPAPAVVYCTWYHTKPYHYNNGDRCGTCASCKPIESDEHRLKREEKAEKERRLRDLTDKRQQKIAKQERMTLFRQ